MKCQPVHSKPYPTPRTFKVDRHLRIPNKSYVVVKVTNILTYDTAIAVVDGFL